MKWLPNKKGLAYVIVFIGHGLGGSLFNQINVFYINPKDYAPDDPYSPEFPKEKYFDSFFSINFIFKKLKKIFF